MGRVVDIDCTVPYGLDGNLEEGQEWMECKPCKCMEQWAVNSGECASRYQYGCDPSWGAGSSCDGDAPWCPYDEDSKGEDGLADCAGHGQLADSGSWWGYCEILPTAAPTPAPTSEGGYGYGYGMM